ncbi:hypothetical protein G9A89_000258 [Geosiphon pyriformis]|nr:hypothetical protein G9A89_000258 [Geosiphon pyriformis]
MDVAGTQRYIGVGRGNSHDPNPCLIPYVERASGTGHIPYDPSWHGHVKDPAEAPIWYSAILYRDPWLSSTSGFGTRGGGQVRIETGCFRLPRSIAPLKRGWGGTKHRSYCSRRWVTIHHDGVKACRLCRRVQLVWYMQLQHKPPFPEQEGNHVGSYMNHSFKAKDTVPLPTPGHNRWFSITSPVPGQVVGSPQLVKYQPHCKGRILQLVDSQPACPLQPNHRLGKSKGVVQGIRVTWGGGYPSTPSRRIRGQMEGSRDTYSLNGGYHSELPCYGGVPIPMDYLLCTWTLP